MNIFGATVGRSVQGKYFDIEDTHSHDCFVSSVSGLTRHKEVCTRPSSSVSKVMVFTCTACQRTFNEERYPKQHAGGKKCERRREFLEKTSSFSLALTASPASVRSSVSGTDHSTSSNSVNTTSSDIDKVCIISSGFQLFNVYCTGSMWILLQNVQES